jgi:hypothetical protein
VVPGTDDLVVAWQGRSAAPGFEIWVNRVAGHLPALDTGQVPITVSGGTARRPSIAADPHTNRFLIAYGVEESAGEGHEVHVQRIDAGLGQVGFDDQQVSSAGPAGSGTAYSARQASASYHPGLRSYLVTWIGSDEPRSPIDRELTGTVLDADAVEAEPQDFAISSIGLPDSISDFEHSAIAAAPAARRWLAVWTSEGPPLANNEFEAYGRLVGERSAANGAPAPAGTSSAPAVTAARLVRRFRVLDTHTRVKRLAVVGALPGMRIELRCRGRGCQHALRRIAVTRAGTVNLKRFVRRARLRPRAVLVVRILEPGAISRVERFRIRDGRRPRSF